MNSTQDLTCALLDTAAEWAAAGASRLLYRSEAGNTLANAGGAVSKIRASTPGPALPARAS